MNNKYKRDWSEPNLVAFTIGLVLITQACLFVWQQGLSTPILVAVTFISGTILVLIGYAVPLEEVEKELQEEEERERESENVCDREVKEKEKREYELYIPNNKQTNDLTQSQSQMSQNNHLGQVQLQKQSQDQLQDQLRTQLEEQFNVLQQNKLQINSKDNELTEDQYHANMQIQAFDQVQIQDQNQDKSQQQNQLELEKDFKQEQGQVQELILEKEHEQELPWYVRLHRGLQKTRSSFFLRVKNLIFGKPKLDKQLLEELEAILYEADVGVKTSQEMLDFLQKEVEKNPDLLKASYEKIILLIKETLGQRLKKYSTELSFNSSGLTVWLIVGVNGVGKTTTIAKLAKKFIDSGKKVVLAAGDTFRAAAIDQLCIWGDRIGAEVIRSHEGGDPGAVVFDSIHAAKKRNADLLIVDTAGRMHVKTNLMDELKKIRKIIEKESRGPHETLLVLDATTGQNAIQQAKLFNEALTITGIIMTKLDGTAKGGVIFAVEDEIRVPIKFIGVGEKFTDLMEFCPDSFLDALFEDDEKIIARTQ